MSGATPSRLLATPRGRVLAGLAGVAAVLVLAAALSLFNEAARTGSAFERVLMFPDFAAAVPQAAEITVADKTSSVTVKRAGGDRWQVPAFRDFPADGERVRLMLLGLSDLALVEAKTTRPDWHGALDLIDPALGGEATAVTVKDAAGKTLAGLLVGRLKPGGAGGRDALYVRKAGENATFLAEGRLPVEAEARDWLSSVILDIPRERIRRVAMTPLEGPAYAILRDEGAENFRIETLPQGRAPVSETAANALGAALVALNLDDVKKAGEIAFAKPNRAVFETADGLSLTVEMVSAEETDWVRLSATGTGKAAEEAAAITARTKDWAYAVPGWKGALFEKPLETLLRSKDAPADAP